ncbi:nucleolus protein [Phlyctema vagabunda]|uniref:25S rRNA adenine-N(1) methyltransferase n=1 Tax=Phlyctema vagabunda TaxID=108571 RepID=A0ABR4PUQ5_9HELO
MAAKKKSVKLKSLSQGRPPTAKPHRSISSKATRTLIRTHHTLEKRKAKAIADGDVATAAAVSQQIEKQGGIESYQRASLTGQRNERGGDSSKILMDWLLPIQPKLKEISEKGNQFRMLEVGALSITNACSRSRLFEVERIDLNSQGEGIKQQDFMERPIPKDASEQFSIISLSLVLNYVPDAIGKGQMLLRTLKFLQKSAPEGLEEFFPSLFLVLPAPCVSNSRYMDEKKLESIMESLGYAMVKKKLSNKLVYYLWRMHAEVKPTSFKKIEIRTGKDRNNFSIVLKGKESSQKARIS